MRNLSLLGLRCRNMCLRYCIFTCLVLASPEFLISQQSGLLSPDGGGEYAASREVCLSADQREAIRSELNQTKKLLTAAGNLAKPRIGQRVLFEWPLRKSDNLHWNSYYGISNFVDHNLATPDAISDYNCGPRSYDRSSGYNHQGTDIFTWPFPWYAKRNSLVEVVAAADGTIIGKDDGNYDENCQCFGDWNAVYVVHTDGSEAWYGHLKNGSLTERQVGEQVVAGEYLGSVASSGCSTGPHLHFEVFQSPALSVKDLIDPFWVPNGCNNLNHQTWWTDQKPYRESTLNANLTHTSAPRFHCEAANERAYIANNFNDGTDVTFAAYYHDQLITQISTYSIKRPNGTTLSSWKHQSPATFTASYWYWTRTMPKGVPYGEWIWQVEYENNIHDHVFTIGGEPADDIMSFEATARGSKVDLTWTVQTSATYKRFDIRRSQNLEHYEVIGEIQVDTLEDQKITYAFVDHYPELGQNHYQLGMRRFDGTQSHSDVRSVDIRVSYDPLQCQPSPAGSTVTIKTAPQAFKDIPSFQLDLYNAAGQWVRTVVVNSPNHDLEIGSLPTGAYFLIGYIGSDLTTETLIKL